MLDITALPLNGFWYRPPGRNPAAAMIVSLNAASPEYIIMDMEPAYRALKKYFGFSSFLPHQEEIIAHILDNRDVMAVIATGGGKSLCFQLPALLKPGTAIVISPLIALMKDQVDGLRENGVPAAFLNSTVTYDRRRETEAALRAGTLKILYVSPEKAAQPGFISFLRGLSVSLIAVDEAHCISQWGHEFRPEYRQIVGLRRALPGIPVIALTATATPAVQLDITDQLQLSRPFISLGSFYRPNLTYEILEKRNAYAQLVHYLSAHRKDSGIIYCTSKKTVDELADKLNRDGFSARPYHAGLQKTLRAETQDRFIRDETRIIVATIAFGMGIDKPDVRFVIHYDLPRDLEHFYQETGRAGRDGEPSDCILLYSPADRPRVSYFIDRMESDIEKRSAYRRLDALVAYCEGTGCRVEALLSYFGETFPPGRCGRCDSCTNPKTLFDGTGVAAEIIGCVRELPAAYGAGYIADVLRGSASKKVRERGDADRRCFGSGKSHSREDLVAHIRELVRLGYLGQLGDRYPVIVLTEKSHAVLTGSERVFLSGRVSSPGRRAVAAGSDDPGLFDRLRRLRKELADTEEIPPYMVFSDATLREMVKRRPTTGTGLLAVRGVGERKLKKYGERFLREITRSPRSEKALSGECPAPAGKVPFSRDTLRETRDLYRKGLTLREIASQRDLTEDIVGAHLESLILVGEAISLDDLVLPEKQRSVRDALRDSGSYDLKVLKRLLGDRYSWNDIRFVRAAVLQQSGERGKREEDNLPL
ncbi:MAG: DNA helicase RecQ [Methanomicrobiaceae archaeon]|nr:DNA helicase RecQ [Methanomicrobiaceae archaeon]